MNTKTPPNTPSQRWARQQGACIRGRRRLGKRSLAQYLKVSRNTSDIAWVVRHLPVVDELCKDTLLYRMRWSLDSKRQADKARKILRQFHVAIPFELL
jgi:hypothetical protein